MTDNKPLSGKQIIVNILIGIIVTVIGGVIVAYIIRDARFSNQQRQLSESISLTKSTTELSTTAKILFTSNRTGNYELYVINADGSGETRLTYINNSRLNPISLSPDRKRIAFVDEQGRVFVMSVEGSDRTQLTSSGHDSNPIWSPDGGKLTFGSTRDGEEAIYIMNADGSNQTRLTYTQNRNIDPSVAHAYVVSTRTCWSPNGERIAFESSRDGEWAIYVMNADGSNLTRVAKTYKPMEINLANLYFDFNVDIAWLPDSTRIAFTSRQDGMEDIFVVNFDGTNLTQLTDSGRSDYSPAWSPDGTEIAFVSNRRGTFDQIWVINADGKNQIQLTNSEGDNYAPVWSPDGTKIAFVSTRDGNQEIYVMNIDGSGQTRLTSNEARDYALKCFFDT